MSTLLFAYHFCCDMWAVLSIWLLGAVPGAVTCNTCSTGVVDLFLASGDSISEEAANGNGFLPLPMSSVFFF